MHCHTIFFVSLQLVSSNRRIRRKLQLDSLSAGWWYDFRGKSITALAVIRRA